MRPQNAPLHPTLREALSGLRVIASAAFQPRGAGYDPRARLHRRVVPLRGGTNGVVLGMSWVNARVHVEVLSNGQPTSDDVEQAIIAARGLTAVDDDPTEFVAMIREHPILGPLARRADPRLATTPTIFESLAVAIIEQLVTGFEARASVRRLWRVAGEPVHGTKLVAAPLPAAVRRVPMWKLHAMGVGSRRAATLHAAAGRGHAIERLRELPPEIVVEKLQSLGGVGPWTANAVARNALGWSDAVPVGDFHAPFTIGAVLGGRNDLTLDDRPLADRVMLEALEPFRPHRARVAILLERQAVRERRSPLPRVDAHRREPWRF